MGERPTLDVSFGDIHTQNVQQLRKLNEHTFPVKYLDKFYQEIPTLSKDFTQFAYYGGFVVGAICGRLEPMPDSTTKKRLYIMTIGVLVAYRECGIGRKLLEYLLENASKHPEVALVYLHVQTNNETALHFYAKAGFEKVGKIEGYYKRIDPPDCFVLCKPIHLDTTDPARITAALGLPTDTTATTAAAAAD
ncbi:hypothetical protein CTAYLR_007918 [Chrysophaeum taylorii]|uniref:N-acetyltransferase domain-containing protein n=1 Tax=Chrysophaeum taylorii TaxID=2483200 RepID=A0AAD7XLL7_9STRA|nr:hypothetical protein CTAYLR_007918 [Chrysophaeum taylorii]